LGVVNSMIPRFGGEVVAAFSLPEFSNNFEIDKGIINSELSTGHKEALKTFLDSL